MAVAVVMLILQPNRVSWVTVAVREQIAVVQVALTVVAVVPSVPGETVVAVGGYLATVVLRENNRTGVERPLLMAVLAGAVPLERPHLVGRELARVLLTPAVVAVVAIPVVVAGAAILVSVAGEAPIIRQGIYSTVKPEPLMAIQAQVWLL
ncbi:hypothetical protein GCM10027341_12580 [Spirosoma knui]